MSSLIDYLLELTDHTDRDFLEYTLAKAVLDLLPVRRVLVAHVMREVGERRWWEVASLDVEGGGKVADPSRLDFSEMKPLEDAPDRLQCLLDQAKIEITKAGPHGPRITYIPLVSERSPDMEGVLEIHSAATLSAQELNTISQLHRVYCNMHKLLAYSERDALTGMLNRQSLDNAFYSAVLEELDGDEPEEGATVMQDLERRHHVPPNYWLGMVVIDQFSALNDQHGSTIMEEVTLLVARIMGNTFRTHDRLYRLSGDEFVVLFHCPEESLALVAFERMRGNVEKLKFSQVGAMTISAGLTRIVMEDSPATALERTQEAVKFVQNKGGNQVSGSLDVERVAH
jgi:diguanylate cyclase (GGDEF)-like protein